MTDLEARHSYLVLRYEDIRAFMIGLQAALSGRHADVVEDMLKETKVSTRDGGNLEKKIRALELKISTLEYFLFGMREAITKDHEPAITRVLETSENATLVAAAIGTDFKS